MYNISTYRYQLIRSFISSIVNIVLCLYINTMLYTRVFPGCVIYTGERRRRTVLW